MENSQQIEIETVNKLRPFIEKGLSVLEKATPARAYVLNCIETGLRNNVIFKFHHKSGCVIHVRASGSYPRWYIKPPSGFSFSGVKPTDFSNIEVVK